MGKLTLRNLTKAYGDHTVVDKVNIEVEDGDLPPIFDGEQKNFNGKKYNVLTKLDRSKSQAFNVVDLVAEDNLGDDTIVAAVVERNERLKGFFGVEIARITSQSLVNDANTAINQGDESYDSFMVSVQQGLELALTGALVDFANGVSYIDLTSAWWDTAIVNNLLLDEGAYIALGDINTVDDDCTWLVLFNKGKYTDYTQKDPSELYNQVLAGNNTNGGWTVEYMKAVASTSYTSDPNVDEKYDTSYSGRGTYGCYLQKEVATVLMQASNNTPTVLNNRVRGGISDNIKGNDEFYNAIDTVYSFMGGADKSQWLLMLDNVPDRTGEDKWEVIARGGFKRENTLFFICHAGTINLIRDMDAEFGILPIPKLSDQQQKYGNTIQYTNATCYVIPSHAFLSDDADENSAYILEAMGYYSSSEYFENCGSTQDKSLKNAYRETVLKRKATRDDESMEMLDLVFDNRVFDLACALNLNTINGIIQNNCTMTTPHQFSSSYNSMPDLQNVILEKLEKLIKGY